MTLPDETEELVWRERLLEVSPASENRLRVGLAGEEFLVEGAGREERRLTRERMLSLEVCELGDVPKR